MRGSNGFRLAVGPSFVEEPNGSCCPRSVCRSARDEHGDHGNRVRRPFGARSFRVQTRSRPGIAGFEVTDLKHGAEFRESSQDGRDNSFAFSLRDHNYLINGYDAGLESP